MTTITGILHEEFDIWVFFEKKTVEKIKVLLKYDNNNGHFT